MCAIVKTTVDLKADLSVLEIIPACSIVNMGLEGWTWHSSMEIFGLGAEEVKSPLSQVCHLQVVFRSDGLGGIFKVKVEDFAAWVSPGCALALGLLLISAILQGPWQIRAEVCVSTGSEWPQHEGLYQELQVFFTLLFSFQNSLSASFFCGPLYLYLLYFIFFPLEIWTPWCCWPTFLLQQCFTAISPCRQQHPQHSGTLKPPSY